MKQRIILIHGWSGTPNNDWFPWAKQELEKLGYDVLAPEMPDTNNPKIEIWVPYLAKVVGAVRADDIFVGHSIGVQTILRFLETLDDNQQIEKVISVAGWFKLNLGEVEDPEIAKPWLEIPIDFAKVKTKADKFIAIFSDNDPYVLLEENAPTFKEKLGAEIIVEKGMGHFTESDGVTKLLVINKLI